MHENRRDHIYFNDSVLTRIKQKQLRIAARIQIALIRYNQRPR